MASFTQAPITSVVPEPKIKGPSERSVVAEQYKNALSTALASNQALLVDLDEDDKFVTIKNRLERAAKALGVSEQVVIRKVRGQNQITVYLLTDAEAANAE